MRCQREGVLYLLFCLIPCAGPLGDDVLLGFGVGCKGERDTGKGSALKKFESASAPETSGEGSTYKIDSND
jgi:hypothetical protein